jgi:hypothetical protein
MNGLFVPRHKDAMSQALTKTGLSHYSSENAENPQREEESSYDETTNEISFDNLMTLNHSELRHLCKELNQSSSITVHC